MASQVLLLTVEGNDTDQVVLPLERLGMSVSVARDPASALQRLGEHQLVILETPDAASLAMLCRRINDQFGSAHPPILAVAHSRDVEARVGLLEAGADDVIGQPIDERELEALVEALLLRAPAPAGTEDAPPPVTPKPSGVPARVIAFASAKGGSGSTTLAVNTALILAEMAPGNVAIADLDMYHGQVSTHLDIYARSSTAALAREEHFDSADETFREAGRPHSGGLVVFGGPYRPDDATDITPEQLTRLVEGMRDLYGTLVVDLGNTLDARTLAVLERADVVALVVTPDIPSLRLLHAGLQVLSETGSATDRAVFVLNHIYPKAMIGGEQIEEHLGIKVGLEIPHDGPNFLKSVNEGQPLASIAPRSPAAVALRKLAGELGTTAIAEKEAAAPAQRRGLFRGLLGRD